jgi:uncharacterized membrane protein
MNKHPSTQKGFLELIVIILIAIILLRFLGIDLRAVFAKQWVIDFFHYIKVTLAAVWADIVAIYHQIIGQ